jgi:hypothetical protein
LLVQLFLSALIPACDPAYWQAAFSGCGSGHPFGV